MTNINKSINTRKIISIKSLRQNSPCSLLGRKIHDKTLISIEERIALMQRLILVLAFVYITL